MHRQTALAALLGVALVGSGLLTGCGGSGGSAAPEATAPSAAAGPNADPNADPDDPNAAPSGPTMTDPSHGYRPAQELKFSGAADGMITNAKVDCTRLADATTYAWTLTGDLAGTKLVLRFNTNRYRGGGTYRVNTAGDGGVMTMNLGDRTGTTDSSHGGTFTVDESGDTGSMNVVLDAGGDQRVTGPWSCTDD
jgi:hypothetical protein